MPTKLPLLGGGEREPALPLSDEELSCLDYVAGYFTDSKPLVSRLIGSVATKARSAPADSVVVRREVLWCLLSLAKRFDALLGHDALHCDCADCDNENHIGRVAIAEAEAALKGGE